jgi:hypothetical protein
VVYRTEPMDLPVRYMSVILDSEGNSIILRQLKKPKHLK